VRVPAETRPRSYPHRTNANTFWVDGRERNRDDSGGKGEEIVREALLCPTCVRPT
jgi:hypothetical protein